MLFPTEKRGQIDAKEPGAQGRILHEHLGKQQLLLPYGGKLPDIDGVVKHLHGLFGPKNLHEILDVMLVYRRQLLNQAFTLRFGEAAFLLWRLRLLGGAGSGMGGFRLVGGLLDECLNFAEVFSKLLIDIALRSSCLPLVALR